MQVGLLIMPLDHIVKVQLDGATIDGYLKRTDRKGEEVWEVHPAPNHKLRTTPKSREAAAMLLMFQHFTRERRIIDREASDVRAEAERDEVSVGVDREGA